MTKVAFKQCEVERLLRAAKKTGYPAAVVEKRPDGTLRLLTEPPSPAAASPPGGEDLDAELAEWSRANGYG